MKIHWNENPLKTVVELDESEKRELWLKLQIRIMKDEHLFEASYHLEEGKNFDLQQARKAVDEKFIFEKTGDDKKTGLDRATDQHFEWYLESLSGVHLGDCICLACTCTKCLAEHIVGINTTEGLRKDIGHYIDQAFEGERNLHQAIEWLATHDIDAHADADPTSWKHRHPKMWAENLPAWNKHKAQAHTWLVRYQNEHFAEAS